MKTTDLDLLSVVTGAVVLTLALARFLEIPLRPLLRWTVFGSPLSLNVSAISLMMLVVLGLTVTGTAVFLHTHPLWAQVEIKNGYMYWIGPGFLAVALGLWLNQLENANAWVMVLLACGLMVPLAFLIEYNEVGGDHYKAAWHHWGQLALIHLTAVILFTFIYEARARSLVSGTAVLCVAALLAARMFWPYSGYLAQTFQYAGIVGLALGQMTWVFNYWRLTALQGGLLLLLLFYLLTGLLQQYLWGQFDDGENGRRILLEYGVTAIIALSLIILAVP